MAEVFDLEFRRHALELRETWQARAIAGTTGLLNALVTSVIAHAYDNPDAMLTLLQVVYPDFDGTAPPLYFATAGRTNKAGQVVADIASGRTGRVYKRALVFKDEIEMEGVFRKLADQMKLSDRDRIQLFIAANKWKVADERLDPTMDPMDPDAKRLIVH